MLVLLFLIIAVLYNFRKFSKEKSSLITSLGHTQDTKHRNMILSYHFHIVVFEFFFAIVVSLLISKNNLEFGLISFGGLYLAVWSLVFFIFQKIIFFLEKETTHDLKHQFKTHIIKELRVGFSLIMLPMLTYSILNWVLESDLRALNNDESFSMWLLEFFLNTILVSVLTIACTVIVMLRLVPNREIDEPEYLDVIAKRLSQIGMKSIRVKWIETDIKNAFVVGFNIFKFSNQTMFIGSKLKYLLTLEEFDAVIAHEISHVANRHIQKRIIFSFRNMIFTIFGWLLITFLVPGIFYLIFEEQIYLHRGALLTATIGSAFIWLFISYSLFFDELRSQEFEADAYAVLNLQVSLEAMKTALLKLEEKEDLPLYLQERTPVLPQEKKKSILLKYFSTHPAIRERISSLDYKIQHQLKFDFYISPFKKARQLISDYLRPVYLFPMIIFMVVSLSFFAYKLNEGARLVSLIQHGTLFEVSDSDEIKKRINDRPYILGPSLMYFLIKRGDQQLISYYLSFTNDKGRALYYLAGTADTEFFLKNYFLYENHLSRDDYFLILLKSSQKADPKLSRTLISSKHFDSLSPDD